WQFRIGQTRVRFDKEIPINQFTGVDVIGHVPEMSVAGTWTRYDSLGLAYDNGPFQFQAMLSRIDQGSAAFEDARSGYAIASYRTGAVTPYVGYSRTKSDPIDFPATFYGAVAHQLSAATHADQHTWFLGARWDVAKNLDLKAQIDRIDGKPSSVFPYREEKVPGWDGKMTVFSLALDFVF
ncbi:porin, partial [Parasulfuritortus cantonensis]